MEIRYLARCLRSFWFIYTAYDCWPRFNWNNEPKWRKEAYRRANFDHWIFRNCKEKEND